ncbi:protein BatD [Gynurincola endophyticus]|uniref:protein BatD n=1 Tax=Gynurincola endophyticus TaxID=2479004 RepID=UPI0013153D36|nr:protein BatD [Gynurincola endophyticus]
MKYIFLMMILCYTKLCTAQYMINTGVDKTAVFVGDFIHFTVQAVGPSNAAIALPKIDSIPHFEIVSVKPVDSVITTNNKRIEQEYTLISFDTGTFTIPEYEFIINRQKSYSDPIQLKVQFSPQDVSGEYKDIHNIEAVPPPPSKFWWWFSGAIIVIALIIFLLNQIKKKPVAPKITNLSSYEEAIKQLQQLRNHHQPQAAEYQVLVNILRGYLVATQGFSATGQTYAHLYRFVQNLKISLEHINALKGTLNAASVSVFALKKQNDEQWQNDINNISNIIIQLNANKI